ncbi:hypothetical protein AOCH_002678 [Aspergillus ochraceoroseus]|uniref:Transposase MuDR plant domain-containing protein n=1 Tax=Aspergillus ochraceoroseus TaxID=138278 RepID=A0A0F8UMT9_9EURO|nr:hypothetical protein AOCH_002678 [Aspergillus ochraceoroseus]
MTEMYSGLHVGQRFPSLEEFKALVRSISVRQHWELRVTRSNKKSVVIGCRSSNNCFFRVVCRANKNSTYISSLQDSHSCRRNATSTTKTPARSEASHVRFLLSEIPKLFDMRNKIKAQDIVEAVKRYHGYDISTRQAQRALIRLQQRSSQNQSDGANTSSGEDRQESQPPPPLEGQADSSAYSGIPGQRWMPEPLQPNLMDGLQQQNEVQRTSTLPTPQLHGPPVQPAHPQLQHPQQVQPTAQVPQQASPPPAPPPPAPPPPPPQEVSPHDQTSINHSLHPQSTSQPPSYHLQSPDQPPPRQPGRPKSPTPAHQAGHPSAPQLVLTNFKIEFTCTTCGALNQSFFPNQGNVTGGSYMPPRSVTEQATTPRPGPSVPFSTSQNNDNDGSSKHAGDAHRYDRARRASTRGGQSPWVPSGGALEVPLPPTHSQNNPA